MSLPYENNRSLKQTHELMRWLLCAKKKDLIAMPIQELRSKVYRCLKHYPFDYQIDKAFKEEG